MEGTANAKTVGLKGATAPLEGVSAATETAKSPRVASIDILRGLTVVLMIVVNDLWSLNNVPGWLGHAPWGMDGIGLADTVYPAFLFLVGLSLPYAIEARRRKGQGVAKIIWHVFTRAFALVVMGLFLVNGEVYNAELVGMHRYFWNPLCCLCFILVWNHYPRDAAKAWTMAPRALGIVGLVTLAVVYRGGSSDSPAYFGIHWWGILGQIGWAYLACGVVTIFARNRIAWAFAGWLLFAAVSILFKMEKLPQWWLEIPRPISAGSLSALTMGGVLAGCIYKRLMEKQKSMQVFYVFLPMALVWIALFFVTRPYWGLAKLGATPAWVFLCSAFTILVFMLVYWVAELHRKANWFRVIGPAGSQTLLCYLMPYLLYGLQRAFGLKWPEFLLSGGLGLAKSLLFALMCVWVTGLVARMGVKLKI